MYAIFNRRPAPEDASQAGENLGSQVRDLMDQNIEADMPVLFCLAPSEAAALGSAAVTLIPGRSTV